MAIPDDWIRLQDLFVVGKAMNILDVETTFFDREDHSRYPSSIAKVILYNYNSWCDLIVSL